MIIYFIFIFLVNIWISTTKPVCKENTNYCLRCNNVTKICQKCEKDIFIPDNEGGCVPSKKCILGKGHCLECEDNSFLCKVCEDRYFPDENGGCSYSNDCEISYQGECLKCKEGFILIGTDIKICKSLNSEDLKNCDRVNSIDGLCDLCKNGFYLNSGDRKCINTENCKQSLFGLCEECATLYYLDKKDDKCKKQNEIFKNCKQTINGINCDICKENYYFNEEGICIDINFCAKEAPYIKCQKCFDGYFPTSYGDSCTTDKNCYLGDKDYGFCKQCQTEFYIDFQDGKCKSNREENDFKYCRAADGQCYDCVYGSYLGKDNKCSLSKYCEESDKGICIQCIDNYHLGLDNICTEIDKCIYSDYYGICTECEKNYYYNRTSKKCEIEKENFENCKITNYEGNSCDSCKKNFYINRTDHLCYTNTEKNDFYKCINLRENEEYCIVCEEGYFLGYIDHKCTTIDGCDISKNENKCLKCDSDYFCFDAKTERCEYNDEIISEEKLFYFNCNQTNKDGNACEICRDGYDLKNGLCVDNSHCIEKNEDGNCLKCITYDEDYFYYCLNSEFGCVEVYSDGCEICNNLLDFDNCTKCMEGFELNEKNECEEIKK